MRDELDLIMVIPCLMPRWPIHLISGGAVPFFVCSKLSFFLHIELCMKLGTFYNCHLPIVADSHRFGLIDTAAHGSPMSYKYGCNIHLI